MKNAVVAAFALGVALALVPSALAVSLGSNASGSNPVNLNTNPDHIGSGAGDVQNGATRDSGNAQSSSGMAVLSPNHANHSSLALDAGLAVGNVLSSDNSSTATPGKGEVAADIGSNELSLLSEGFGERHEIGAAGSGHFYFGDKPNSRGKSVAPKGMISRVANVVTLAETPEPESLFLLGTGLMFMALVLFWKSGKRTTES